MANPGGFAVGSPAYGSQDLISPTPAYSAGGGQPINPGSITYTTSTGPDGRVIYHPFRAVPASYQTPNGIVSGIQWVPAEATQVLPAGAQPANADFAASWNRGHLTREDEKSLKQWQRDEEKRRRKEEKDSSKRLAQYDRDRRERDREEQDLRRRKSFNAGAPGAYPVSTAGRGYERDTKYGGNAASDLTNRFRDMGIDGRGDPYERERKISSSYVPTRGEQDIRRSPYTNARTPYPVAPGDVYSDSTGYPPSSAYSAANLPHGNTGAYSPNTRPAEFGGSSAYSASGNVGEPFPRAPSPYARSTTPYARAPSPYGGGGAAGAAGVYPRGHILEGQPMNRSRAPSPLVGAIGLPGGGGGPAFPQPGIPATGSVSPNIGGMAPLSGPGGYSGHPQEQLAAPEGFSRPINAAQPYTPFDTMKIQDMDAFLDTIPKMPLVLQPHDVYHTDWIRFMQDLALSWAGKLPLPEFARNARAPKQSTLAADLIDLWNSSFFLVRGVEVVLYKGRQRRSGPNAGVIDRHLPTYGPDDSYSDLSSTDSSDSDDSGDSDDDRSRGAYGGEYGLYGRQSAGQMADYGEARRRRRERKNEKKRRHKEKKMRKKAKERENKYALYLTYVPNRPGGPGVMPTPMGGSMGPGTPIGGSMGPGMGGGMGPARGPTLMPGAMGM